MGHIISENIVVSVVMPLYNAEQFVTAALTSILKERSIPLEVIVVDDGSTDASLKKVQKLRDPRLRIIKNNGKGIASAVNTGLAAARGDIFVRCDADDLYPADRLKQQVEWLTQHPDCGAVCGNYAMIDARGESVIQFHLGAEAEDITPELQTGTVRTHFCTFAVRTERLRQVQGCRPYFLMSEDIDLQLRLSEICQVWYLPYSYYQYRLHGSSITHSKPSSEREFFDAIARTFQQQRSETGQDRLQQGCPPPVVPVSYKPSFTAAQHIQGLLLGRAWQEYRDGSRWRAFTTIVRSVMTRPSNWVVWRSAIAMVIRSFGKDLVLSAPLMRSTLR